MSQAEQHELPAEEGGGRLNWLLAVLVLVVTVVMGVVLAAGVQSSGVSTQPAASTDPGDGSATGRYLLIPQGTKLLGSYQNASAYGQHASRSRGSI